MARITTEGTREIVEDFAEQIRIRQIDQAKPSKHVINFRNERRNGKERDVCLVPIDLLRYRKDNGRIASDVLDYERTIAPLDENDEEAQKVIRGFLEDKNPERTDVLLRSIAHEGQQDPAIITCDGFLINGNRRKMVMERLQKENPSKEEYKYMKVVILPGKDDKGGPPTLVEIEKIENRYQLQSEGKAEYYSFDRALSIKRKIELGFTLKEQLTDDPAHAGLKKAELNREVTKYKKEYLDPLNCIDRYLRQFDREGLYRTVSTGVADREGRWQAFLDYSNTYNRHFADTRRRIEIGIEEDEIGELEAAAFDIIRLREVPGMPKVHVIMRDLHKYCQTQEGKKAIRKIAEVVEPVLPREERVDSEGNELSPDEEDAKWAAKNKEAIIYNSKKAYRSFQDKKEKDTPIDLLRDAHKKLIHDNMDLSTIKNDDLNIAREIVADIIKRAEELDSEIYRYRKNWKKLTR